jgi:hypothetical protein
MNYIFLLSIIDIRFGSYRFKFNRISHIYLGREARDRSCSYKV